jgi:DNA-binding winged helix-turn-helix (wHTH) protein/TolB-like protein/Flp pilus assembly protein TadD
MIGRVSRYNYAFGPFRLDPDRRVLRRANQVVPLAPKAFELLLLLVESSGQVLEKRDLMERLWPGSIVEEANLSQTVYMLRRALSEGTDGERYIETMPKRGYQFVGRVVESPNSGMDAGVTEAEPGSNGAGVSDQPVARAVVGVVGGERPESIGNRPEAIRRRWWERRSLIAMAYLAAVAATVASIWLWQRPAAAPPPGPVRSLAVLPVKPLAPNSGDEHLGSVLVEALITRLGDLDQVIVKSTSAISRYENREIPPLEVGRELQVDAVLEGTLQRVGDRLRITIRLHDVRDGRTLWGGKFDQNVTDIFEVQDTISDQVATALSLNLTRERRHFMLRRYTENAAAYELYLKGRYWWNRRTVEDLRRAIGYFQEVIAVAPDYALAYAGLADCYSLLSIDDEIRPQEAYPRAREAAIRALEQDRTLAEAYTSLGWVKWVYDWDWDGAERDFKRAIEISPDHSNAYDRYGVSLAQRGDFDGALAMLRRAQQLDPLSLVIRVHIGWVYFYSGQNEEAIAQYMGALELDPDYAWAHFHLSQVLEQQQRYEEAIAEMKRAMELSAVSHRHLAGMAHIYAVSGRTDEARRLLGELLERGRKQYVSPFNIALIYAGLGENDEAFIWLRRGVEQRVGRLVRLEVDPRFSNLRSDPRFTEVRPHSK